MTPLSRRDLAPVGELLVSYEAGQMPTATLERLTSDTFEEIDSGAIRTRHAVLILGHLLRIAIFKIRALEGSS